MHFEKSPPELIALFHEVCPTGPFIEPRKMFGYPCFFVNGHLAGGLHEGNFLLHLSDVDRVELDNLGGHVFSPFPGRTMKEYAVLPESILNDRKLLGEWIERSVTYCASLPPKNKKR